MTQTLNKSHDCLTLICKYLPSTHAFHLQQLNQKFYNKIIPKAVCCMPTLSKYRKQLAFYYYYYGRIMKMNIERICLSNPIVRWEGIDIKNLK